MWTFALFFSLFIHAGAGSDSSTRINSTSCYFYAANTHTRFALRPHRAPAVISSSHRPVSCKMKIDTTSLWSPKTEGGGGDNTKANTKQKRQSDDQKWFMKPVHLHESKRTYFEETWGPILLERRKEQVLARSTLANRIIKTKGSENTIDHHVQRALDAYSDDSEEEKGHEQHRAALIDVLKPAEHLFSAKSLYNAIDASEAPRCGPRSSSPRGRAMW